ncbi:CCA tRNA nucleotidyltransferase [Globicatella sanguinis]
MKIELTDPLFLEAQPILKRIESHGYEAYFVGGCVRDTLLGKTIHDIDIASSALPHEIEGIFYNTIDVGKEHGTIIVVEKHIPYEITTFRTEGNYSDFRHPDTVNFVRDLREDTLRRDFTINALAFDAEGQLFDYHHGVEDLQAQLIRAVGVPAERFQEDALRIIRAIRFASQLGFAIEPLTFEAIQQYAHLLPKIAVERVRIELSKYFQGSHFKDNSLLLFDTQISQHLPLLDGLDCHKALQYMNEQIPSSLMIEENFAWFLFAKGLGLTVTQANKFLRKWTHSNHLIQDVKDLYELDKLIQQGPLTLWEVYHYKMALINPIEARQKHINPDYQPVGKKLKSQLVIQQKADIVANGKTIMGWLGLEKGNAQLGALLREMEYQVVMRQLPNEEAALKAFALNYGIE